MSERAIRTIWSFLGVPLAAFCAAAVLRTTGSDTPAHFVPLGSYGPYGVTLLAIPIGSVLTFAILWLTGRYADTDRSAKCWAERLPIFYFDRSDIDPSAADGRKYQLLFLVAFVIWPAVAQGLLFAKFLSGTGRSLLNATPIVGLAHFWPVGVNWSQAFHGGYSLDGLTYYPGAQPWLYTLTEAVVLLATVRVLRRVFVGSGRL